MTTAHYLGIELGSTRIKAVLIDHRMAVVATGSHTWENQLIDGYWTYDLDDVWTGLQQAYAALAADYTARTGQPNGLLESLGGDLGEGRTE